MQSIYLLFIKPDIMTKIHLLLLLFAVFFYACTENKAPEKISSATLKGMIENPIGEEVKVSNGEEKYSTPVEEGQFSLEIPVQEEGRFTLKHGNQYAFLYLEPGDDISLTINAEEFDQTLQFTGKGAEENNYIIKKYLLKEDLTKDFEAWYSMAPEDFVEKWNDINRQLNAHFIKYSSEHKDMSPKFLKNEKTDIRFAALNQRLNYRSYYKHFTKEEVSLPVDFNNYLQGINLNDTELMNSKEYKNFLRGYLEESSHEKLQKDGKEDPSNQQVAEYQLNLLEELISEQEIRDYLTHKLMKGYLRSNGVEGASPLMIRFAELNQNEEQKKEILESYDQWKKIAVGAVAPNFAGKNLKGETIDLESLKGKNVYIDVWATWCGPCRRELPHLEKLEAKYGDKGGLVFASISIDENEEAWEKMVVEKEMKGLQLLAANAWDSDICKQYQINGIPRFILVDRQGNIIDANAPRPSHPETDALLAKLAVEQYTTMKQ